MRLILLIVLILGTAVLMAQKTGFEKTDPAHSNILFSNDIVESDSVNITMYDYLYNGGGVGVGDFNRDGLPDLFFTGNFTDDKLYINKGDFVFEDVTVKAGITKNGWSTGVCIFDVNGDGLDDIYVCRSGWFSDPAKLKNVLYINLGNLKFKEDAAMYGLDLAGHHTQAAPLDFDRDGDLDLYVMGHPGKFAHKSDFSSYIQSIQKGEVERDVLLENVNGKYVDVTKKAGIFEFGYGLGLAITDINRDDYPDIIVCNDFDEPDHIFVNQRNKTFWDENTAYFKHTSNYSMGNDVADFNNDGLLDYISVDMAFETHQRAKVNMASMTPAKFWARVKLGWNYQYMHNMLQLNTGRGVFQEIAQFSGIAKTDWSWAPLFVDIDMDGWQDLFISNGYKRDTKNNDIQHLINEELAKQGNKSKITVMEMLQLIPSVQIENFFFRNNRDLTFADKRADWGVDEKPNSNGAAYADLDNDGDFDLVLNNVDAPASLYKNVTKNESNYLEIDLAGVPDSVLLGFKFWFVTEKTKQHKEAYFVRGYQSTVERSIIFYWEKGDVPGYLECNGYNTGSYLTDEIKPNSTIQLAGLLKQTPLITDYTSQTLVHDHTLQAGLNITHTENEYDDFEKETLLPHRMSDGGPALAVGDFNNDGLQDFITGSSVGKIPRVFIQKDDGTFGYMESPSFFNHQMSEDESILVFDVNGDKNQDLLITSGGYQYAQGDTNYANRLYIGNGLGMFGLVKNALPVEYNNSGKVIGEDIDKDGDTDLLVCGKSSPLKYPYPGTTSILVNGNGFFANRTPQVAPGLSYAGIVNDATFSDVDGDGDRDLILVGEWMDILVFINTNGTFEKSLTPVGLPGWWSCVTANDIDGDGDEDLLLGNAGLNNKFKPSKEKPLDIYANDFDGNGSLDIVLAYTKNNHLLPVRGKECSTGQMPFLAEKFPTYLSFADADLYQIYSREKLDAALHYSVTEFQSGILYNDGKGSYTFKPFENAAQLSFINAFIVRDVNDDGKTDILAVGNRFGTEVETTRYDAGCGLCLLRSGGDFKQERFSESGFFVPGDARAMAEIRIGLNGKSAVLITNNQGKVQLFMLN